jgi:hypothetical protein
MATLSPRDRQWVLSHREQLTAAFDAGDMARIRRIFGYQLAEADDPGAVERVWQLMMRPTADPRRGPAGPSPGSADPD